MEPASILQTMLHYKEYYPQMKGTQLRFHLELCKKFKLVPTNDYPNRPGGYQHLEVDTRDNRKPLYEIKKGVSIEAVLNVLDVNSDTIVPFTSQRTMLQDWVRSRGYLELVTSPFDNDTRREDDEHDDDFEQETQLQQLQQITVPGSYIQSLMAVHCKRIQNVSDHLFNLTVGFTERR